MKVNELLDDPKNTYINDLVSKIWNIYKNAVKKVLVFKRFTEKPRKGKWKKTKPKKQWMTNDCLLLRKEVKSLSIKLHREPNNCALRQTFSSCRKEYNRMRKKTSKRAAHRRKIWQPQSQLMSGLTIVNHYCRWMVKHLTNLLKQKPNFITKHLSISPSLANRLRLP